MKKIGIFALVMILTVSLAGCFRRKPEPTTMPSTVAPTAQATTQPTQPSTAPTTQPSVPTTNGTVPYPSGGTAPTTEGILPGMDDGAGNSGTNSTPMEGTAGDQARRMPRY